MRQSNAAERIRRMSVRFALATLTLGAILLIAGPGPADLSGSEPEGLQFEVRCAHTGAAADGGDIGAMTCALVVSGLPEPLQDQVSLTLFTAGDRSDTPSNPGTSDTVVASEAPDMTPGAPALVIRSLPIAPPPPLPLTPQVPEQPPKAL